MTPQDWRVLDWPDLRNAAKNDIVKMAYEERIAGFLNVGFVQKGSKQFGYNLAVPVSMAAGVALAALQDNPPLRNSEDDPELTPRATGFDEGVNTVAGYVSVAPAIIGGLLIAGILVHLSGAERDEAEQYLAAIAESDFAGFDELDLALMWALTVVHDKKYDENDKRLEWLQDFIDEAEQILGEAEDKGQL